MINMHKKLIREGHFQPHCYFCGCPIHEDKNCVSYRHRKVTDGTYPNTIWLHAGSCLRRFIKEILNDVVDLNEMGGGEVDDS